jgi:uncharacterized membrane-anchored protein YjiN (DUF445 family)
MPKRNDTHNKIRMAIVRMEKGKPKVVSSDRKISIKAVAEEAGVSDSLIHKDHSDLVRRIYRNNDKDYRSERDKKHQELKAERVKSKELRGRVAELESQLLKLASINARLELELTTLRSVKNSQNVTEFRGKKS